MLRPTSVSRRAVFQKKVLFSEIIGYSFLLLFISNTVFHYFIRNEQYLRCCRLRQTGRQIEQVSRDSRLNYRYYYHIILT